MHIARRMTTLLCCTLSLTLSEGFAQFVQQGGKLVGTGGAGASVYQGSSVSLSADGNTAIVGGMYDSNSAGAAWVFVRSGGAWSQQVTKLVGTGAVDWAMQGSSVSLSADGNTAIIGGEDDNNWAGAAWIFTRSGNVWSQQGGKLVGAGAMGTYVYQGHSVSLSADGTTALVGGHGDSSGMGAAWVFIRSGTVWSQQGGKLVGAGAVGTSVFQGFSVSLSADGNTALVGGAGDSSNRGAAWVFTRSGGGWSQQGSKLVGSGDVGPGVYQGISVSLSANGNTAIVGGSLDSSKRGAAWVFARSGGVWSQQGGKLVGSGAIGAAYQGQAVSLSADGNTAIVGGPGANGDAGAAWLFTSSGGVWSQLGDMLLGAGAVSPAYQGYAVSLSADGSTAILGGPGDSSNWGAAWVFTVQETIVATAGQWGEITPSGPVLVSYGESQRFSFIPSGGYHVDSVIVDGVNLPDSTAGYTFTDVTSNHTIRVAFAPLVLPFTWAEGWNMVSVPVPMSDYRKSSLYPTALSPAFTYRGGYERSDTLQIGVGYWVRFGPMDTLRYMGPALARETVYVSDKWNMIGSISMPIAVSTIVSIPGGIATSAFFGYAGEYTPADSIRPGRAYWVRTSQSGKLILSPSTSNRPAHCIRIIDTSEFPPPPPGGHIASCSKPKPTNFALEPNYPNPFNPVTTIRYALPSAQHVKLSVYNMLGQEVAILVDEVQDAGYETIFFDAVNLPSGAYTYRMVAGSFTDVKKLLVVR